MATEQTAYTPRHAPPGESGAPVAVLLGPDPAGPTFAVGPGRNARRRSARRRSLLGTAATMLVAGAVAMLLKMFVLQAFLIPSGSMETTLQVGDHVLTNRLAYELHGIHRGDIVVFSGAGTWDGPAPAQPSSSIARWWHGLEVRAGIDSPAGTVYVKRVIGLPGDTVACCDATGHVTVNGIALNESSYVHDDSYWAGRCSEPDDGVSPRCFAPVTVAPGMLWVMGDHRAVSDDSRRHLSAAGGGAIESSRVIGKAVLVLWPQQHFRTLGTPATFGGVPAVAMVAVPLLRRRRRGRSRRTLNRP